MLKSRARICHRIQIVALSKEDLAWIAKLVKTNSCSTGNKHVVHTNLSIDNKDLANLSQLSIYRKGRTKIYISGNHLNRKLYSPKKVDSLPSPKSFSWCSKMRRNLARKLNACKRKTRKSFNRVLAVNDTSLTFQTMMAARRKVKQTWIDQLRLSSSNSNGPSQRHLYSTFKIGIIATVAVGIRFSLLIQLPRSEAFNI